MIITLAALAAVVLIVAALRVRKVRADRAKATKIVHPLSRLRADQQDYRVQLAGQATFIRATASQYAQAEACGLERRIGA
jgi:hypothetical protein